MTVTFNATPTASRGTPASPATCNTSVMGGGKAPPDGAAPMGVACSTTAQITSAVANRRPHPVPDIRVILGLTVSPPTVGCQYSQGSLRSRNSVLAITSAYWANSSASSAGGSLPSAARASASLVK